MKVSIPSIKIGDSALAFAVTLARMNPQLRSLFFMLYVPLPGANKRAGNLQNRPIRDVAGNFLHHDNSSKEQWQVAASDLTVEMITQKISSLGPSLALGLESKCTLNDGSISYIPMMDFKLSPSEDHLALLKGFLEQIACRGIIVDSGRSYHFYGFDLLDQTQWIHFMGACLLVPWSDSRWIGHSLIAGGGDLRISATDLKPKLPLVVEVLS